MTAYFSTGASLAVVNQLSALTALLPASSTLKIYTDAAVSGGKDPDTAFAGTLLATFTFGATPWTTAAVSGSYPNKSQVATANFSASTVTAAATGTAATFGLFNASGTLIATGSVTATGGGGDITFNSVAFSSGANVALSSFTLTQPE